MVWPISTSRMAEPGRSPDLPPADLITVRAAAGDGHARVISLRVLSEDSSLPAEVIADTRAAVPADEVIPAPPRGASKRPTAQPCAGCGRGAAAKRRGPAAPPPIDTVRSYAVELDPSEMSEHAAVLGIRAIRRMRCARCPHRRTWLHLHWCGPPAPRAWLRRLLPPRRAGGPEFGCGCMLNIKWNLHRSRCPDGRW